MYTALEFIKYQEKDKQEYSKEELIELMEGYASEFKLKSEKWDKLDEAIGKYYEDDDFSGSEYDDHDENEGSLLDIGETAAIAFGYL